MRKRPTPSFRPTVQRLEEKLVMSAGSVAGQPARLHGPQAAEVAMASAGRVSTKGTRPLTGFLVYRVTNPTIRDAGLKPPFGHVFVQAREPVRGGVYNILQVAVKNVTKRTFDAGDDLRVRLSGQKAYTQILTGDETWKPGQDYIFYVLTKKYYPLANPVTQGFEFVLGGSYSIAIPGPSGIFQRIKYNPATINKILDFVVTKGPGTQGGKGIKFGLPDTAIYAFVSARENRQDFGGYF